MCGKDNDFFLYAQEKRRNVDSVDSAFCVFGINGTLIACCWDFFVILQLKSRYRHGFQLSSVFGVSAHRFPTLLAGVQACEVAKRADCGCELCFLWLVGLAFSHTYRVYFVVHLRQWCDDRAVS